MKDEQTDAAEAEDATHNAADYVVIIPNKLDKYGQVEESSFKQRRDIMRNMLAAKLVLSWYATADNRHIIIRVSASEERLVEEADRRKLMMRKQEVFKEDYEPENETFVEFQVRDKSTYFNPFQKTGTRRFTSLERHRLVFHILLAKHNENGAYLPEYASKIHEVFPMHCVEELEQLKLKWYGPGTPLDGGAEREVRDYFGEKVALYFAFLKFYTGMLKYMAVAGLFTTVAQVVQGEDSMATPIFGFGASLWSVMLAVYWTRQENTLKSQWNVEDFEENEKPRPEYQGTLTTNGHTGEVEIQDQSSTTSCKRIGLNICALISTVVFTFLTLIPTLARSEFLGDSYASVGIASIATFVLIYFVNGAVKRIAIRMTNAENQRTDTEFTDSLIFKIFLMQFFPTFGPLFYTAYVQDYLTITVESLVPRQDNCWETLCIMLTSQFLLHLFVGNSMELMYVRSHPRFNCIKCMRSCCRSCCTAMRRCWNAMLRCCRGLPDPLPEMRPLIPPGEDSKGPHFRTEEEKELTWKISYPGPLADYNELLIQYGFVIMFAPAFPLGAAFAWLTNILEFRVDAYKMCELYRRPLYECAEDIGLWFQMLQVVSTCAVVTNAILIAYTTKSFEDADVFDVFGDNDDDRHLAKLCCAVGMEHLVFFFQFLCAKAVDPYPDHVKDEKKRRLWEETQEEAVLIKDTSDPNAPYVVRNRMAMAPEEYEHHVDEV